MRHYEVTFIVDPILSKDDVKALAQNYINMIRDLGCTIVYVDEMGLRQLAYPIKKKYSGVYYSIEYALQVPGEIVDTIELTLRRDERIIRFLTVALDKFGVKFNEDKRNGLIGKKKEEAAANRKRRSEDEEDVAVVRNEL